MMSAYIIAFPTVERAIEVEFDRTGETDLTRAIDEAIAIAAMIDANNMGMGAVLCRLAGLERSIRGLTASRPEAVDDEVIMPFCRGSISWTLRGVVAMLRRLAVTIGGAELNDNDAAQSATGIPGPQRRKEHDR